MRLFYRLLMLLKLVNFYVRRIINIDKEKKCLCVFPNRGVHKPKNLHISSDYWLAYCDDIVRGADAH